MRAKWAAVVVTAVVGLAGCGGGSPEGAATGPVTVGAPEAPHLAEGGWFPRQDVPHHAQWSPRRVSTSLGEVTIDERYAMVFGLSCVTLAGWLREGHGIAALVGQPPPGDFSDWGYACVGVKP